MDRLVGRALVDQLSYPANNSWHRRPLPSSFHSPTLTPPHPPHPHPTTQIRWLMHFVRQMVMNHMGGVCHILGNKQRHAECMVAAQHDHRLMVKALPDSAMGYRWVRLDRVP